MGLVNNGTASDLELFVPDNQVVMVHCHNFYFLVLFGLKHFPFTLDLVVLVCLQVIARVCLAMFEVLCDQGGVDEDHPFLSLVVVIGIPWLEYSLSNPGMSNIRPGGRTRPVG